MEWSKGEYTISTDKERLDVPLVHEYLSTVAYWALGRPLDVVKRSIDNSVCFGIYLGTQQVGFTRVVTDHATFAWLADVFILPDHRGQGLSTWLLEVILAHPELQGLRRWLLATRDAHGLYKKFGFKPLLNPEKWMEIDTQTATALPNLDSPIST